MVNLNFLGFLAIFILPILITLVLSLVFFRKREIERISIASFVVALIGAFLPSIIIASGYNVSGAEPEMIERILVFISMLAVLTILPSWPLAYWAAKRQRKSGAVDYSVFR